jgi:PAS domain S-box-containing protein
MRFKAWRGLSEDYRKAVDGHSPWSADEKNAHPITIPDAANDPSLHDLQPVILGEGIGALGFIPLTSEGRLLGKFMIYYNTPHQFTEEEIQLAQTIANHVAFAIDRKRKDHALQESHSLLQSALDAGRLGAWQWDISNNRVTWTDRVYDFHGLTRDTFGGDVESWTKLVHPDDWQYVQEALQKAMEGNAPYELEFRTIRSDGEVRWLFTRAELVRDSNGAPYQMIGITHDITERVKDVTRIKEAEQELREAARRKDEFLATLAHELRNPLAPVRNAVHILRLKGQGVPEIDWARDVIDRQMQHMARLIDDLLDVSRISSNKLELRKERIEIRGALQSALQTTRAEIEERNHQLVVQMPESPIFVEADETRLEQVFLNILDNAAKYTENGGRIEVSVLPQETEILISFKDNGVGIPPESLPSIFEMFSQVQNSFTRSRGGLGIGLHLAKRLVEMHNGRIEARSEGHGKGSEFLIYIPVALTETEDRQESIGKPSSDPHAVSGLRVLVVDDILITAMSFAMMLEITGNEVKTAQDGEEAVSIAAQFRPDVALIDVGLPKMNGYEVAGHIRQQDWGKEMILIAVTGWGQESDKDRAREAGFDKHMVKPLNPADLLEYLSKIQTERRMERRL